MALSRFLEHRSVNHLSSTTTCWLRSLDKKYNDIELSSPEEIKIGRSKLTNITDIFCSKSQLKLKVNLQSFSINIEVNGSNSSGLNGFLLEEGCNATGYHDDKIEILYGKYPFRIDFIPPPSKKFKQDLSEIIDTNVTKMKENIEKDSTSTFPEDGSWDYIDNNKLVIFTSSNIKPSNKIAGFDLDWTIIKTKTGNVFPKNPSDWDIMLPEIPGRLQTIYNDGFKICFFTNQAGISRGQITLKDFQFRIESIIKKLKLPIQIFISTSDGMYRKPVPGMWDYLENKMNDNIIISKEQSFYVGDAAGRSNTKLHVKIKRDHSAVDRLFAMNIGIKFYTPDEYFLKRREMEWTRPEFNPKLIPNKPVFDIKTLKIPSKKCEIILMVGLPGSGKSSFVSTYLQPLEYDILNADTLGSVLKCLNACENNFKLKKNCVIDNTNLDKDTRKKFIIAAQKFSISIRCFVMNTSIGQIKHNLTFRYLTDKKHTKINDMIFNSMKKKFIPPTLDEGFEEIVQVDIIPKFENVEQEKLYKMFLTGK